MTRLENLFRKLFPSVTTLKNPNAHFSPRVLLTLLQNRGSEITKLDVNQLHTLTASMAELQDKVYSAVTGSQSLDENQIREVRNRLQECSMKLDELSVSV